MVEFKVIPFGEITKEDLLDMKKYLDADPWFSKASTLKALLKSGDATLWRMTNGVARGIFVTELAHTANGLVLVITVAGGKGMVKNLKFVNDTFMEFCKRSGIKKMRGVAYPKLGVFPKELGWTVTKLVMEKEIE